MQKIVITGNIGAGKSTIVKIFQKYNVPLFDADSCIRDIYQNDISFKQSLSAINPQFIKDNAVSKPAIVDYLEKNSDFLTVLERLLYPILHQKRQEFIDTHITQGTHRAIFEVPLLFEKNLHHFYDYIILVYAPYEVRLGRVLERTDMRIDKFNFMNKRQIDYKKLLPLVDLAIDTTQTFEECERLITRKFFV